MECLRCGAKLKDNALVCKKCGFVVKGSKKLEKVEPPIIPEEKIDNIVAEERCEVKPSHNKAEQAPKEEKKAKKDKKVKKVKEEKKEIDSETLTVQKGQKWAKTSFICGLIAIVLMVVPGINVIAALVLFLVAFMGFGQCAGQKSNLALTGVILAIVAICGSWAYNSFLAPAIGEMLGFIEPVVEQGTEVVSEVVTDVAV